MKPKTASKAGARDKKMKKINNIGDANMTNLMKTLKIRGTSTATNRKRTVTLKVANYKKQIAKWTDGEEAHLMSDRLVKNPTGWYVIVMTDITSIEWSK